LVIEPITWLADGNSIGAAIDAANSTEILIAASRAVHLLCVFVAVPLMFVSPANTVGRPPAAHQCCTPIPSAAARSPSRPPAPPAARCTTSRTYTSALDPACPPT
jgi:hypothetical protein